MLFKSKKPDKNAPLEKTEDEKKFEEQQDIRKSKIKALTIQIYPQDLIDFLIYL